MIVMLTPNNRLTSLMIPTISECQAVLSLGRGGCLHIDFNASSVVCYRQYTNVFQIFEKTILRGILL